MGIIYKDALFVSALFQSRLGLVGQVDIEFFQGHILLGILPGLGVFSAILLKSLKLGRFFWVKQGHADEGPLDIGVLHHAIWVNIANGEVLTMS